MMIAGMYLKILPGIISLELTPRVQLSPLSLACFDISQILVNSHSIIITSRGAGGGLSVTFKGTWCWCVGSLLAGQLWIPSSGSHDIAGFPTQHEVLTEWGFKTAKEFQG